MLPRFTPNFELLKFMDSNWANFYQNGAYALGYAQSYVRVNWLLNEYALI